MEQVKNFLHTEFYPYEGMGIESLEPIQKIKQKVNLMLIFYLFIELIKSIYTIVNGKNLN